MGCQVSKYNYYVKVGEKWAVFNTNTCGLFLLDERTKAILSCGAIEELPPDELSAMTTAGLIVDDDNSNEYALLLYHQLSAMYQTERCFYEILPTTGCNARCFYCFEDGVKTKWMSPETADAAASFIASHNSSKQLIHINWFGGEPLLNTNAISIITNRLTSDLPDVTLYAEMTTNGTLFTDELIYTAINEWKLRKVQITLDGQKSEYERRKSYVNFPDAYETVINNIEKLAASGIHVSVRLNADQKNVENLANLIEELAIRFGSMSNVSFYAYPLFNCGKYSAPDAIENSSLLLDLYVALVNNGLVKPENAFGLMRRETQCFARNANGFLIAPDGNMYKCSQVLDNPRELVGNVFSGVKTNAAFLRWVSPIIPKECTECVLFPLCLSGCKSGELGYGDVRHYIYRNILEVMIKTYIELNHR